jgi:hypothetical protein
MANFGAPEDAGWIRGCSILPGDAGSCAGISPMETDEQEWFVDVNDRRVLSSVGLI